MLPYPKIETLYDRNERFKVMPGAVRLEEFGNIKLWLAYEKIDGTNIRVHLTPEGAVQFGGKTDNAQIPAFLVQYLRESFTDEKVRATFEPGVTATLYGEGYGTKIQNGGSYRAGVAFRLFDVLVGSWWLEPDGIQDVAGKLGVLTAPYLGILDVLPSSFSTLSAIVNRSIVAEEDGGMGCQAEGIVARTAPGLFTRKGERLMWKLKFKDF